MKSKPPYHFWDQSEWDPIPESPNPKYPNPDQVIAAWEYCGYPTVAFGHKLAASIAMTDVPPVAEVLLPWMCFEVQCPARVLCDEPCSVISLSGNDGSLSLSIFRDRRQIGATMSESVADTIRSLPDLLAVSDTVGEDARRDNRISHAMALLLFGACVELQAAISTSAGKGFAEYNRRRASDPLAPRHYVLNRPVIVDARTALKEYIRGNGSPHTVQSMVRGHRKRQPYGPSMAMRKWIVIEPYFRGQEDAPMALRPHKL